MENNHLHFERVGAKGALLDEYERAVKELKEFITTFSDQELVRILDAKTDDEDCRSIQSILTHVVCSGIGYIIYIRNAQGEQLPFVEKEQLSSIGEYQLALQQMFSYAEQLFIDYPDLVIETFEHTEKINVSWGQQYDVEQMFEHAIVHILRHRRQLEGFKKLLILA